MTRRFVLASLAGICCLLGSAAYAQDGGEEPGGDVGVLPVVELPGAYVKIFRFSGVPRQAGSTTTIHPQWSTYIILSGNQITPPMPVNGTETVEQWESVETEQGGKSGFTYAAVRNSTGVAPPPITAKIRARVVAGAELGSSAKISLGTITAYKHVPAGTGKDFEDKTVSFTATPALLISKTGTYELTLSPYID